MKKKGKSRVWLVLLVIAAVLFSVLVILPFFFLLVPNDISFGNVALIEIRGMILEDSANVFGQSSTAASEVVTYINDAAKDPSVKAIVVDINSPGGSAVASDEIAQALKNSGKPTVSLIHEIGTSGGYWIASSTDHIISHRLSITGSIGVIASYLEFSNLLDEHGVSYQRFVGGKYKDLGSPFKEPTDEERLLFQKKIDRIHDVFIDEVAKNRDLSFTQVRTLATGEIFLGEEALENGLIDQIGDETVLRTYLKEEIGIEDIEYKRYQKEPSLLSVLAGVTHEHFFFMGKGIGQAFMNPQNSQHITLR